MDPRLRARLVLHGAVVFALGLVAGFPYGLVVLERVAGSARAWRMAHMEGVLNGLLLLAVAGAGAHLRLSSREQAWLAAGLLVTAYGNAVASIVGATFGVRGLTASGPPANLLVFALFTAAIVGVGIAVVLLVRGAARARRSAGGSA